MTRQDLLYILIILATLFVIYYLLGCTGAPLSSYVRYSALVVGCEGGLFVAHRVSGLEA